MALWRSKTPYDGLPAQLSRARMRSPLAWFDRASPRIELRRFAGCARHQEHLATPLCIAHLTDLHVGRVTPMAVQMAAVDLTNRQDPDLVVITGDFVCHSQEYLDQLTEVIQAFDAPVIGVLGNHDHWSGAAEVRAALRRAGAELLDNVNTILTVHGERLQLVGIDDSYTGHADIAAATKGLRKDVATLGLSHIAEEAERLWLAGVPLVLSGHTHAGQVTLARLNELALGRLVGHRYIHGLYGDREAPFPGGAVYVGAGIGAAVIPLRLGERARREVTLFELGYAPGAFDEHHREQAAQRGRPPSEKTMQERQLAVARKQARRDRKASQDD